MRTSPERSDIKKLYALSGNRCAFPRCNERMIDTEFKTVIGEMCHIKGNSPGSARYDPDQDPKERNSYSNLIVMCPKHHKIIDENPDKFPVELLLKWKRKHEGRVGIKSVVEDWVVERIMGEYE